MEELQPRTLEQIQNYINRAKDSVWVITDVIQKLTDGAAPSKSLKGDIERNVGHLKIVVDQQDVIDSGEDISELQSGISAGESKLAENIWPAE